MAEPSVRTRTEKSPIYRLRGQNDTFYPNPNLSPENTEILQHCNITETGSVRRSFGSSKYNSTQITESSFAKAVTGLRQQIFSDGTTRQIVSAGTKVYDDDGSTRSDITGSLTLTADENARCRYGYAKDYVVVTDGVNETYKVTNTGNATALGGVTWTTCEDIVVANNLLVSLAPTEGGTKYPTRIRWCDVNPSTLELDIETWPVDSVYELYEGSEPIIGGVEFRGRLFVVKSDGIYPMFLGVVDGFIEVYADDQLQPLRGEFEPIAKNSILALPNFMFCVASDGAYRINPDLSYDLVTSDIQETWNSLSRSRLKYAVSHVRKREHQVVTYLSSASNSSGHDRVLVYDYETGDVWIEPAPQVTNYAKSWILSGEEFDATGSTDGYIRKGNDPAQSQFDGSDISWKIRGAANDLGYPGRTKTIVQLITYYKSKAGLQTINNIIYRDDGLLNNRSKNLILGVSLLYNTGKKYNSGLKYGGGTTAKAEHFVNRTCDTISPQWSGTQDFELIGYQVEFQITE